MSKTVTRLFDTYADAERAVARLESMGVSHSDISIVANNADGRHRPVAAGGPLERATGDDRRAAVADESSHDAGKGASIGAVAGGAGGLLAGLGILAIPGLGPVVAAGWLVSTLAGSVAGAAIGGAAGGLVGALTHAGVDEDDAQVYAEGVRRGGTLVSARVADDQYGAAEAALREARGVDARERGASYREGGWSRFDENAPAYTSEQIAEERASASRVG